MMIWRASSALLAGWSVAAMAQGAPGLRVRVDAAAARVLEQTGVPSAQVGIVVNGKVVLTVAYGNARIVEPGEAGTAMPATPEMKYAVGSITKQFTAAAVLLAQQDGKLSLDDRVSRWFPELTRGNEVTVRELLSHTSGYEDYAPQDYTIPAWEKPVSPLDIVHQWAEKPLDFDPGTQWQYSNTNFVLAALLLERATGTPYWKFLQTRILKPLGLTDAIDLDTQRDAMEPRGYMRNALGPLRHAVLEAPGWYFGDGNLAMPVASLLKWDVSLMDQTLLQPASYRELEDEVRLKDGTGSHYGLGVSVRTALGRRMIEHSGEVGGFVAENIVFPDSKVAVAVLTNQEASSAASEIAKAIVPLVLSPEGTAAKTEDPGKTTAEEQAKQVLTALIAGKVDRSLFTADCNSYFSQQTIGDFVSSLAPLGPVTSLSEESHELRGGMVFREFTVGFAKGSQLTLTTYTQPDGKLEQFLVGP